MSSQFRRETRSIVFRKKPSTSEDEGTGKAVHAEEHLQSNRRGFPCGLAGIGGGKSHPRFRRKWSQRVKDLFPTTMHSPRFSCSFWVCFKAPLPLEASDRELTVFDSCLPGSRADRPHFHLPVFLGNGSRIPGLPPR